MNFGSSYSLPLIRYLDLQKVAKVCYYCPPIRLVELGLNLVRYKIAECSILVSSFFFLLLIVQWPGMSILPLGEVKHGSF